MNQFLYGLGWNAIRRNSRTHPVKQTEVINPQAYSPKTDKFCNENMQLIGKIMNSPVGNGIRCSGKIDEHFLPHMWHLS